MLSGFDVRARVRRPIYWVGVQGAGCLSPLSENIITFLGVSTKETIYRDEVEPNYAQRSAALDLELEEPQSAHMIPLRSGSRWVDPWLDV